jgi:hypothetical protein
MWIWIVHVWKHNKIIKQNKKMSKNMIMNSFLVLSPNLYYTVCNIKKQLN